MLLSGLSKFYIRHPKLFTKLLNIFVFSHPARTYIKMMLGYPGGAKAFLTHSHKLKQQYKNKTKYFLSIVAIMKNESPYIQEWIEYHKLIGVEKFYLYDNDSTDNTKKILQPYIKSGLIEYIPFPGEKMQIPAYNHFIKHYKHDNKWTIVIDLDEFIVAKQESLIQILQNNPDVAQLLVPWVFFGSNGHKNKPNGLVIENYTRRAKKPRLYKAIVQPQLVLNMECHKHIVAGKTIFPKMDKLMVNHYYCKSLSEFERRATRGDALNGNDFAKRTFDRTNFDKFDINDVDDTFILKYANKIKSNIKK